MDPQPPSNLPASPDLTFQVMPQDLSHPEKSISVAPLPPPASGMPRPSAPLPPPPPRSRRNIWVIVGAIVIVALIGFGLYYFLGSKKEEVVQPQINTRLPKVWLQQYFSQNLNPDGSCSNQTICGDDPDPDNDGLNNYDEFKTGTTPTDADTDKDGLADGDEVQVYKTVPTLKYTDRRSIVKDNDWTDSFQIKNGYDPLTPGKKFTDSRLQQIQADTATYPLHEPTLSSLKNISPTQP